MRLVRMLGIAVIAASLAALIGTASAMAETPLEEVVWCKAHEIPCRAENILPAGTIAHAKATNTVFITTLGNIACGSSAMTLTNSNTQKLVHGEVTSLTFGNCALEKTSCTVEALHLAWLYKGELQANNKDYEVLMTEKGTNGEPQLKVKCGALVSCTFGAANILFAALLSLPLEELNVSQELNRIGGLCPSLVVLHAEYEAECLGNTGQLIACWIKME